MYDLPVNRKTITSGLQITICISSALLNFNANSEDFTHSGFEYDFVTFLQMFSLFGPVCACLEHCVP